MLTQCGSESGHLSRFGLAFICQDPLVIRYHCKLKYIETLGKRHICVISVPDVWLGRNLYLAV